MNQTLRAFPFLALTAAISVSEATDFTNSSPDDNLISNPGNWDNGLPTGGNGGTIAIDAGYSTDLGLINYDITHTVGTVSRSTGLGGLPIGEGTTYRMNGPTAQFSNTRGISINGVNAAFILDLGIADATNNSRDSSVAGTGTITVNGGSLSIGRHLFIQEGTITVNGGSVNVPTDLGSRNFHTGGELRLNGGSVTAANLTFGTGGFDVVMGGTTPGSLIIDNFGGNRHNASAIGINFLPGSGMSMQITAPVESGNSGDGDLGWMEQGSETGQGWAEALWSDGRLTYNGETFEELGNWATVNGTLFNFDTGSNTLSLASGGVDPSGIRITSLSPVDGQADLWQVTIEGAPGSDLLLRSSPNLAFPAGNVIENLTPGVPNIGTISGSNNTIITTDANGQATIRVTLSGHPADFLRAETAL